VVVYEVADKTVMYGVSSVPANQIAFVPRTLLSRMLLPAF
jgi:hypothetical protein